MHMTILDPESSEPLYAQLRDILKEQIEGHEFRPGERIPSEEALIRGYGVSRITVRRALSELVAEGYLTKRSGKGSFVSPPDRRTAAPSKVAARFAQDNEVQSFTDACLSNGQRPGARLVSCREVAGFEEEREFFGFGEEGRLVRVERARTADGVPIMVEENYFPADSYAFLLEADFRDTSLFSIIAAAGRGEPMLNEPCQLDLEKATAASADLLDVPVGEPLFCLRGRYFDSEGNAMYLGKQRIVGTRYTFRI